MCKCTTKQEIGSTVLLYLLGVPGLVCTIIYLVWPARAHDIQVPYQYVADATIMQIGMRAKPSAEADFVSPPPPDVCVWVNLQLTFILNSHQSAGWCSIPFGVGHCYNTTGYDYPSNAQDIMHDMNAHLANASSFLNAHPYDSTIDIWFNQDYQSILIQPVQPMVFISVPAELSAATDFLLVLFSGILLCAIILTLVLCYDYQHYIKYGRLDTRPDTEEDPEEIALERQHSRIERLFNKNYNRLTQGPQNNNNHNRSHNNNGVRDIVDDDQHSHDSVINNHPENIHNETHDNSVEEQSEEIDRLSVAANHQIHIHIPNNDIYTQSGSNDGSHSHRDSPNDIYAYVDDDV